MLWQAEAGMRYKMPQGYFMGPDVTGKPMFGAQLSTLSATMENIERGGRIVVTTDLRHRLIADIQARQVSTIIVGPTTNETALVTLFTYVLEAPPERLQDVYAWWNIPALVAAPATSSTGP